MGEVDGQPDGEGGAGRRAPRGRRSVPSWRSLVLAPVGDGRTRRRGSDGVRLVLAVVAVVVCATVTRADSHLEHDLVSALTPPPDGVRWLAASVWWLGTVGVLAALALVAAAARRWNVLRDTAAAAAGAWVVCVLATAVLGTHAGRPVDPTDPHVSPAFPVALVAATVAATVAAVPFLSRPLQRLLRGSLVVVAVDAVVHGAGLPVSVVASVAVGIGVTAALHLAVGSPLGLPSAEEVGAVLTDLGLSVRDVRPRPGQEWGVGRFTAADDAGALDVSLYGRDAADAQLLAKVARFALYRDSGPTLTWTRRQQVEHEAYVVLSAERAGCRVPAVVTAGPAGPTGDAVLVTRPPAGRTLDEVTAADGDGAAVSDAVLDAVFAQVAALGRAGVAHGALAGDTLVVDGDGSVGVVDFRVATTMATTEQLDRDLAAALAVAGAAVGGARAVAAAARTVPAATLAAALPFLQGAALGPRAGRAVKGRKELLAELRTAGAAAAGVDVPDLIEPRRISWVTLLLVVGTLIGGWALIGVLVNVGRSWDTITGARWGWVALTFVLAQAAMPAVAVTTVGSVTSPLPFGRSVALEVSNTFVGLAGGSMAVLATRVRFFQQEGYDATLAVSSGIVVSTASWIVKGVLFLVALPFALGHLHFTDSPAGGHHGHGHVVALIVIAVVAVGVLIGLVLVVPRWRRLAADRLRPKAEEVWSHLRVLAAHPRNLVEIFGGNVAAQVLVALALGASLHAFGAHLGLATLLVVLTLGSMLGGVSPVPGGMGVVEAGLILGLTAAGIDQSTAVAAVFVQRLFTAYLPPVWGWFVLVWMRRREYL